MLQVSHAPILVCQESRGLGRNDQTGNRRGSQSRKDTRNERRESQTGNITTTGGSELAENTDLDTQGTNVSETAARVSRDKLGSSGEVGISGVRRKGSERVVLVLHMSKLVTK